MKELKDIKLKKDDRIYLKGDASALCPANDIYLSNLMIDISQVVKIERPTQYETIYEAPKQILDQKEKQYLGAVIRPFKDKVKYISKREAGLGLEYLKIDYDNGICDASWTFPYFKGSTMYKGMELDKEYTLKELGLFE